MRKLKKKIPYIILTGILFLTILFTYQNDFLYQEDILKITSIEEEKQGEATNDLGLKDEIYSQKITGIYQNGPKKGQKETIENTYSSSLVVDEKYRVGDKVLMKNQEIEGLKRDYYFVFLISFTLLSISFISMKRGATTLLSLIGNIALFYLVLFLYYKDINIIFLMILASILFTIISLTAASGINKKTLASVLSVLICTTILFLLIEIVSLLTNFKGVNFNILSYLTVPPEEIFIASLLIGGLGAIMDVCITITSSVNELIETNKEIKTEEIIASSKEIGKDIMPTMINVLFFTYFCSGLPTFVLAIRNGFTIHNYLTTFYSLDITRFLCGSIGICLSIPVSTYLSIKIFKKEERK